MQAEDAHLPAGDEEAAAPGKWRVEGWMPAVVGVVAEVLEVLEAGAEEQELADSPPKGWGHSILLITVLAPPVQTLVRNLMEEEQVPIGMLSTSGQLRTGVKI